jgi:hypothetical protein
MWRAFVLNPRFLLHGDSVFRSREHRLMYSQVYLRPVHSPGFEFQESPLDPDLQDTAMLLAHRIATVNYWRVVSYTIRRERSRGLHSQQLFSKSCFLWAPMLFNDAILNTKHGSFHRKGISLGIPEGMGSGIHHIQVCPRKKYTSCMGETETD